MSYMTEGVLGDILDVIDRAKEVSGDLKSDPKKYAKDSLKYNKQFKGSISSQAKKLIATFPVVCTNSIDIKTANLISKAIERKCVLLLEMIFGSSIINQFKDGDTASDYLNKFFNNLDFSTLSVDDLCRMFDLNESTLPQTFSSLSRISLAEMNEYSKGRKDEFYEDSINESSIQNFRVSSYDGNRYDIIKEAQAKDDKMSIRYSTNNIGRGVNLRDADVKKANELVPSLLVINYMANVDGAVVPTESIIGVKARLVPVSSNEIVDKIYTKNSDSNGLVNLCRATTGEIHFVKDLILAVDRAKVDAISRSRKGSVNPIWKVLERRSLKQKINKSLMRDNDAAPITTLVMTTEEVEFLKKQYNIYLDKTPIAKQILDAYNLLCLVIVDETSESASFLFDEEEWETLSFHSLERESSDSMYKKVLNLMSKVR